MKTILYNPIFINPQAYYVFPRLTRYLQPDNESTSEPANYIGTIEVKVIAYGDTTLKRTYTNTDSIDLSEFKNTWIRISLFTKVGSCVLGEWKIGNMESDLPYIDPEVLASLKAVVIVGNKTNNDSDRAIVKNLVDPDNPFVISNAAYTEGSGYADKGSPYYGAFVTDGVDDLITSTKTVQEMLGGSNEITVVSMIHQIGLGCRTNFICDKGSYWRCNEVANTGEGKTGIYGYSSTNISVNTPNIINNVLGDKVDYSVTGDRNDLTPSQFSVVGYISSSGGIAYISSIAWYWTIIANKVLTTDQINQVIAYFNLDRTLNPDILCDIEKQGITNENHAEFGDKLIDFSGNGRDIQLNNIAWKGDSGIGKYEVDFLDTSIWNSSNSTITSSKIDCKNAISHIMLLYYNVGDKEYPDIPSFKVIKTGADIDYSYIDETGSPKSVRIVDGVNVLPASHNTLYSGSGRFCGFGNPGMGNSVTITQIPSHAGALYLDGVNDFGKVTGMPIYKDYTVVADREIVDGLAASADGGVALKGNKYLTGAFVFDYKDSCWSFGGHKMIPLNTKRFISYQSKYVRNGISVDVGTATDNDELWIGRLGNEERYSKLAIRFLMSFPYSMSEFLIERQLKKHKLGTLYPDMVEFRPIISSNIPYDKIEFFNEQWTKRIYPGDYVEIGATIKANLYLNNYDISTITSLTSSQFESVYIDRKRQYYDVVLSGIKKSPQKITMTIEQDENYVKFEPVITSNVEYVRLDFYLNDYQKRINIGDYIPKDAYLRANLYLKNNIDELTVFTFNGVNIGYRRSSVDDTAFNINQIYNYDSPQEVNIIIDEYIRYEDIVQPYPVLLRFNDENGNEVSWGGKFRVGSTITRIGSAADSNLLPNIYNIFGLLLNGNQVTSSKVIVEKTMVFKVKSAYIFDNNEPKCILSPKLLRIPNSSYKILGHIPDISGHGNHGVIHNSAYAEGSGVNEDGSYQLDGVDDFVTIPTVAGKQVLMKLNWQNKALGNLIYDQRDNNSTSFAIMPVSINDSTNNKIAYQARNANGITYIDGIRNEYIKSYSLKNINHNITITNPNVSNKTVALGASNRTTADYFAKYALYDFMLFDEISTDNKIKELNEYVGIEAKVELPPYYWDTYGKTNLDADKATIQQRGVAVGDYDLTNTNFAYDKMSGFGGYEFEKFTDTTKWIETKREDGIEVIEKNDYSFTAKKVGTGQYFWDFKNNSIKTLDRDLTVKAISNNNVYIRWEFKYRTAEKPDIDSAIILLRQAMTPNVPITVTLPYKTQEEQTELGVVEGSAYYLFYFDPSDIPVGDEYTVEMLPLYTNGLVYDGITDYSKNANIPALDDFTAIIKREWLKNRVVL